MSDVQNCVICGNVQGLGNYQNGTFVCEECDYCSHCGQKNEPMGLIDEIITCTQCMFGEVYFRIQLEASDG